MPIMYPPKYTDFICKPIEITFKSCLESEIFPLEWKKANVAPVHKKITNNLSQTTG